MQFIIYLKIRTEIVKWEIQKGLLYSMFHFRTLLNCKKIQTQIFTFICDMIICILETSSASMKKKEFLKLRFEL